MKKFVLFSVIVILPIFVLHPLVQAYQNELIGFRGLKWGDPPTKDMEYLEKPTGGAFAHMIYPYLFPLGANDVVWYTRENDKLQIGVVQLEYIHYVFYEDKFVGVQIRAKPGQISSLEDVLNLKFGSGTQQKTRQQRTIMWSGDIATVIIESDYNMLTISSTKIYDQYEKNKRRKAKEEAHRKEEQKRKNAEKGLSDLAFSMPKKIEIERKIKRKPQLAYPLEAEEKGIRGKGKAKVYVALTGQVVDVVITSTSAWLEFDKEVYSKLLNWKFSAISCPEVKTYDVEFSFSFSPTKLLSPQNKDFLSSTELAPIVVQGQDKSYLKYIRPPSILYMFLRREKKQTVLPVHVFLYRKPISPVRGNVSYQRSVGESEGSGSGAGGEDTPGFRFKALGGRQVLRTVKPGYPEEAEKKGITGSGVLKIHVLPTGQVVGVTVLRSSGWAEFDRAASQALRYSLFSLIPEDEGTKEYEVEFFFETMLKR